MKTRVIHWFKFASPQGFYFLAGRMWPWFAVLSAILMVVGLWISFFVAFIATFAARGRMVRAVCGGKGFSGADWFPKSRRTHAGDAGIGPNR